MAKNTKIDAVFNAPTLEEAFTLAGLPAPEAIQYTNVHTEYAPPGKSKKRYWYRADERGAAFGDVATSTAYRWEKVREDGSRPAPPVWTNSEDYKAHLAKIEADKARAAAEKEAREKRQALTAESARETFEALPPAPPDHPYLVRKDVQPGPCKVDGAALVVPIYGPDAQIQTLQYIQPDGGKKYLKGGKAAGGYLELPGDSAYVLICEGFATGQTLRADVGHTVFCAFSAGQIRAVAETARARYPEAVLVYCADNDVNEDGPNVGLEAAHKAAKVVPGIVCAPPARPGAKVDFNDLHAAESAAAVWHCVTDAIDAATTAQEARDEAQDEGTPNPAPPPQEGTTRAQEGEGATGGGKAGKRLLDYVMKSGVYVFADQHGEPYLSRTKEARGITYRATSHVNSQDVRDWLGYLFYGFEKTAPSSDVVSEVVNVLRGNAKNAGGKAHTAVRVFEAPKSADPKYAGLWLDLCNDVWEVVHVTAAGWSVKPGHEAPCRFIRTGRVKPLPTPVRGGTLDELREVVNVKDEDDLALLQFWLVYAVRMQKTYPILAFTGEAGSAKTTAGSIMKRLIDPGGEKTSPPRDEEGLVLMATSSHVLMVDNFSTIPGWMSDAMCRMATGAEFTKRKLYTDFDAVSVYVARPVIITSIADVVTREDLQDRTVTVTLRRISEDQRRTQEDVDEDVEARLPRLLGALLDVVAQGLRTPVPKGRLPRMADFGLWSMRCEAALGKEPGTFEQVYKARQEATAEAAVEADDVARPLVKFLEARFSLGGTFTALVSVIYDALTADVKAANDNRVPKYWPGNARAFSSKVRKLAPALRKTGIHWEEKHTNKGREMSFTATPTTPAPAPPAAPLPKPAISRAPLPVLMPAPPPNPWEVDPAPNPWEEDEGYNPFDDPA